MAWNPSLHPRLANGRFAPKYVPGSATRHAYIGKANHGYRGVKVGAEFDLGPKGRGGRVLVKGIAGYRPPKRGGRKIAK